MGKTLVKHKLDYRTSRNCLLKFFMCCIGLVLIVFPQFSCPACALLETAIINP